MDFNYGLVDFASSTLDMPAGANEILRRLEAKGFASDNVVFGVGSWSYLGQVSRDTLGWAMKATNEVRNGKSVPTFKDPKTDNGTKKSVKGYLKVGLKEGSWEYTLKQNVTFEEEQSDDNMLRTIYNNTFTGYNTTSLEAIRKRLLTTGE